jgi:hypothetical protein
MFKLFNNLTTVQKSLVTTILSIILFIASAGVSYSVFSGGKGGVIPNGQTAALPGASDEGGEDPSQPKTESCPLNGSMHTKAAKDIWDARRPLAVMIENHTEARPQSGLSSADVVYEAVAEGGITRFMGVYLCNISDTQVGPVRSARTYFVDWLSEYDALYAHVGGANTPGPADALGQIIKYDIKDLNQFSIGFPTFWRDYQRLGHSVATEHTMYSTTNKLWEVGAKRDWKAEDSDGARWDESFTSWKFKDDSKSTAPEAAKINVEFWSGYTDFGVTWNYDVESNLYKRDNGGQTHLDLNNKKQLNAKNVIVQFEKESHANDGYEGNAHLLYGTIGQGKALFFQDGKAIEGKWIKTSRTARTKYVDAKGREIQFNRGLIWVQTIPEGAEVKY